MAELLGVAASVTGVLGFGMQVCSGVSKYLEAVKAREKELRSARANAARMTQLLDAAQRSSSALAPRHDLSAEPVRRCVAACEHEIRALDDLLSSLSCSFATSTGANVRERLKQHARTATYAFHRDGIDRLQTQMSRVNEALQTALQIAGLNVAIATEQRVAIMEVATFPRIQEILESLGPSIERSVTPLITSQAARILGEVRAGNTLIRDDVNDVRAMQFDIFKRLEVFESVWSTLSRPERQSIGYVLQKPGHLREVRGETDELVHRRREVTVAESRRSCPTRIPSSRRWHVSWGPLRSYSEVTESRRHVAGCEDFSLGRVQRRWSLEYFGLRRMLDLAIGISFSYNFGAGGASMSSSITCYPCVDRKRDPVFRIINMLVLFSELGCLHDLPVTETQAIDFMELCVVEMVKLFRHGISSPRAVDAGGSSYMHLFVKNVLWCRYRNLGPSGAMAEALVASINTLISCGVPAMRCDAAGYTPAWNTYFGRDLTGFMRPLSLSQSVYTVQSLVTQQLCSEALYTFLSASSALSFDFEPLAVQRFYNVFLQSRATAEAFECGPLSLALIAGNTLQVSKLLAHHPSTISEVNILGQTPFHFAVHHPPCLRLLIRLQQTHSLLNNLDIVGRTALEYATYVNCHYLAKGNCTESLRMLLEADCKIPQRYPALFRSLCATCTSELLRHIKERRERLKTLGRERLPRWESQELGLETCAVLDAGASRVVEALRARDIAIPASLENEYPAELSTSGENLGMAQSIYHYFAGFYSANLDYDAAYDLGFYDVDERDYFGHTPLFTWRHYLSWRFDVDGGPAGADACRKCLWLIKHGADLWAAVPDTSFSVAHYIYSALGNMESSLNLTIATEVVLVVRELTQHLSQRDIHDACRCKCSSGGCSPFVWFLRRLGDIDAGFLCHHQTDYLGGLALVFRDFMDKIKPIVTDVQFRAAIRFGTFQALEIRHTCCHDRRNNELKALAEDEIDELEEEDAHLLGILEDLVTEFDNMLPPNHGHGLPLVSFWDEHWLPRMRAVQKALNGDQLDEAQKRKAEDIGVVWECPEPQVTQVGGDWEQACREEPEVAWPSDIDEERMYRGFKSMNDWVARLNLIVSQACPS